MVSIDEYVLNDEIVEVVASGFLQEIAENRRPTDSISVFFFINLFSMVLTNASVGSKTKPNVYTCFCIENLEVSKTCITLSGY